MDSDLASVNGKSGRQSWRYADAFQRSIISEAIYHFYRQSKITTYLRNRPTSAYEHKISCENYYMKKQMI